MRLLVFLLAFCSLASAQQYRAFWADAFNRGFKTPAEVDEMIDNAVAAHANAIFMQARRRGDVYYTKSIEPPAQDATYDPNFDALDYLIQRAHARNIEVHAWFVVSRLWTGATPPRDPRHFWNLHGPTATGDDFWLTVSSAGRTGDSIDLGHPAASLHIADLVTAVARNYPAIDGLHLDYIRYPEEADFGWNPKAIERFQRLENRTGSPLPSDTRWSDFRRRQVTQLVRQIYLRANEIKPSIKISAALITWGSGPTGPDLDASFRRLDAYSRVFQDWRSWLEEGILDLGMPMNYFADARNAAFLDRWLAFERERQFKRAILPGLGIYLNPIPASISQLTRALDPASGTPPYGVAFYSYASTNESNARPAREFYTAAGNFFGSPATPPDLPWKRTPTTGHAYGWIRINEGPAWLADGATVRLEPEDPSTPPRLLSSDGNGFFGAVDLLPSRYLAAVYRAGKRIHQTAFQTVSPGATTAFEITLTPADFDAALPRLHPIPAAAPGDIVTLTGENLTSAYAFATAVPLPAELSSAQLVINGIAAPLLEISPTAITFQIPYLRSPDGWTLILKHQGLESPEISIPFVPAKPTITAARRLESQFELTATGLGFVDRPVPAGQAWPGIGDPPQVVEPVFLLWNDQKIPATATLIAYQPGQYRVTAPIPASHSPSTTVRLQVGDAISTPVPAP